MPDITTEETSASSKKSLSDALAKAIQSTLKGCNGNHNLKLTVIIEGFAIENGEFKISVKVLIIDPVLEQEKAYRETDQELKNRIEVSQELNEQMHSAIYSLNTFDKSKIVQAIENRVESLAEGNNNMDFNARDDNITLIAPSAFHERLNQDIKSFENSSPKQTYDAPGLDLGSGSHSTHSDDEAA